jgi:ankyrin repeat protein
MLDGARPSILAAFDGLPERSAASIAARLSNDRSSFMCLHKRKTSSHLSKYHKPACTAMLDLRSISSSDRQRRPVFVRAIIAGLLWVVESATAQAQTPPSRVELAAYAGLHKAAADGSVDQIRALLASKANPNARDKAGRTPLHVAAFASRYDAVRALVGGGGDINALENDRYDVITIAAVKDDLRMVNLAIELGGNPRAITSRYDGTALIAAAHLGHDGVVKALIEAGAPLDHVNNLGWTALIEAVVLGDGGERHVATAKALVAAGANRTIGDRNGVTPLQHAQRRHYQAMVAALK